MKTSEKKSRLVELSRESRTIVLYEAPHRIIGTLEDILKAFGDRNIAIVRELTKKFEEIIRGSISDVIKKVKPRGEFVVVIEGRASDEKEVISGKELLNDLVRSGISKSEAVKIVSKRLNIPKNELYRAALDI